MTTTRALSGRTTRGGLGRVGAATVVSAASSWVLQAIAGRLLSLSGFIDFMAVWGLFFALLGLFQGIQQVVTRAVSSARAGRPEVDRPLVGALLLGVSGAVLVTATGVWWCTWLFGPGHAGTALPFAFALVVYAVFNLTGGALAGSDRWDGYAGLILVEAVIRCGLVVVALTVLGTVGSFAWALAAGGVSAVVIVLAPSFRFALTVRGDETTARFLRSAGSSMLAAGCSALAVAGFPFLLKVTAHGELPASAGVVIAAVVATRAPLLLTLNAYQAAAISRFVRERDKAMGLLYRLMGLVGVLAVVGSAVAGVVGPELLRLLYGPGFRTDGLLFVGLTLSAGCMSMLMLSGSACVAAGRFRVFSAGWVLTAVTTTACLSLDLTVEARVLLALFVGPLVGLAIHLAALEGLPRRAGRPRA
jgi:O-antigen/teichoic acid export membrane protein